MDQNESREYFELKLPDKIKKDSFLIFTVKESRRGVKEGDELFSDPDIYVSKSNQFPSNREEASWYSERYGNDILTIPSYEVESNEIFYVCMYCQYKCRYELNSYLAQEIPIQVGKYYDVTLSRKAAMSYSLYVPSNNKGEELNVVANNPSLKNFRIYMAKEMPSSQNTFQIIPSWAGGYVISVSKYNRDYCTDCVYHILFQTEEEDVKISFTAYFQSTLSKISAGNVVNDVVKAGSKRCYYFDTSIKKNLYDSKLILNLNLFSGNTLLHINGWKSGEDDKIFDVKNKEYSYNIENEKVILLHKEDFEAFDKALISSDSNEKNLHFCIFGQQMASYILSVTFLSEVESLQRYNYISPGSELTGYLQGGQVTKYRILDFNLNRNSIITLSFTPIQGRVEFFSTFCDTECEFNDENLKDKLQQGQVMLASEVSGNKKAIVINPENNECYKQDKQDQINYCQTLALVKCFGNENDICSFKILPSINDQAIFMSPKKTYYNILAKGKVDLYEISVEDEEVSSIVVVLTSVTGDAELQVVKNSEQNTPTPGTPPTGIQSKISRNKDYIPDVVRITPNLLGAKSVVGKYTVKITSVSFSSYNLYYYTTRIKSKDEQPALKDITLSLSEGNIIKDYFPNDISYKIFSYTPQSKEKEDIKIILTRINVHFSFKVYLDFNKIKYNYEARSKFEERLTGYDWASDHNNELTISKNDNKYSIDNPYYIVVTKDSSYNEDENDQLDQNTIMSYYLGITKRGIPFTLNEGIEHSETLSEKYDYQNYFYIHKDINNPLSLELNILNGQVDVFINTKQLTIDDITKVYERLDKVGNDLNENDKIDDSVFMDLSIDNYASIEINDVYFNKNCKKNTNVDFIDKTCFLYITVIQSKNSLKYHRDSQYIINAKSSLNTGMILLSGNVYNIESKPNKTDHYIIEEVKHRKGITINVNFKNGGGQVYARIPKSDEIGNKMQYPDVNKNDYIGSDTYMGKLISIEPKVFDRINSESIKLQILITVIPEFSDAQNVEYSITYGSEPKRISQNIPYQSFLKAGEMHYFTFYFDESAENIYISLSNMNGDADMYLNYGNDRLPSVNDYQWSSSNLGHEYIDINIKDRFFKKKNMKSVSGYYSLLVLGYTETTYTLYVSSHPDKIMPLIDNIPVSCRCQIKGEKCYYRYNNVFDEDNSNLNIFRNEIIFTTQYIYGNGKMYASVYKEQELTDEKNKKYQQFFPTETDYQFSNALTGKRNYLKVVVEENKYSKDSLILLTYICGEKTDVEITAASLQYSTAYSYIDPNRENMFYLKYNKSLSYYKQEESVFNFYSSSQQDLIYELHAYVGSARIKIFTNESVYNENNELVSFDYNHIAEFNIKAEKDDEFYFLKTYTESYFNSIKSNLIYNKNLYFKVKPMSDFGFYIQVTYDRSWVTPPIGEPKSYLINQNQMYGYFDINPEFSNVEFSLSLKEYVQKKATVYIKILVGEKDAKKISNTNQEDKLYHYEIPSQENYDYKGKTDEYIGVININLNNLPILKDNEKNNKFIRALFAVQIKKNTIKIRPKKASMKIDDNIGISEPEIPVVVDNKDNLDEETISIVSPQTQVTITVTPGINNFKRIDLPQHTYYFSNTSLIQNYQTNYGLNPGQIKEYDGNKEVKIYSLDKRSNEDRKMVIQMHVCSGKYDFKISKKIVDYDNNPNDIRVSQSSDEYGRSKYLIDNLRDKHIYLSVKSAQNPKDCINGKDANGDICSNELSYLIYYYSLTNNEYSSKKQDLNLKGELEDGNSNRINIGMTPLSGMDRFKNVREQNTIEYNLFFTGDESLKDKLDNICYLSKILSMSDMPEYNNTINNITIVRNIKLNANNGFLIDNLDTYNIKGKAFVNILARNLKTNELVAYVPLSVILEIPSWGLKRFFISILLIFLFSLVAYAVYNYFKNKVDEGYQNPNKVVEMGSVQSKNQGYQRINL